jgi:hypothetical protein
LYSVNATLRPAKSELARIAKPLTEGFMVVFRVRVKALA